MIQKKKKNRTGIKTLSTRAETQNYESQQYF